MSSLIRADYGRLETLTEHLGDAASLIERELEQLRQRTESLRSQWSGEAQHAFNTAHTDWDKRLRSMRQILVDLAAAAQSARESLRDAERQVSSSWS